MKNKKILIALLSCICVLTAVAILITVISRPRFDAVCVPDQEAAISVARVIIPEVFGDHPDDMYEYDVVDDVGDGAWHVLLQPKNDDENIIFGHFINVVIRKKDCKILDLYGVK